MLLCTVRDCKLPLERQEQRLVCAGGHSFDVARSGYVNLLQPQDRRSRQPGDSASAMQGRRRLYDRGVMRPILEAIAEFTAASSREVVLDAGCGDGFYLGTLAAQTGLEGHGVDISIPAIDAAARRYPGCQWVVANADRFVPYPAGAFSLVMSITARHNSSEFRRVLRRDGRLLLAIPSPDDLIELRGAGRERAEATAKTFAAGFKLLEQRRATTAVDLDTSEIEDLRHSIYRPLGSRLAVPMRVTFSLDLLLFQPT